MTTDTDTDVVERLSDRIVSCTKSGNEFAARDFQEYFDVITRLRTENAALIADRDEMRKSLTDFIDAYDKYAVDINSPDIDSGGSTFPWHDEWLHRARTALSKEGE